MGDQIMVKFNLMAVYCVLVVCFLFVSSINSTSPVHFPGQKRSVDGETPFRPSSRLIARFNSLMLKRSALDGQSSSDDWQTYASLKRVFEKSKQDVKLWRFRRDDDPLSRPDEDRVEYEKRLFISLRIVGSVPATRLYVPEDPKLFPVGTVVGKVQKLHPHGKVVVVWPYQGFRNFTVNEDTGDVKTTALMDFELIRSYNMTIRDFQYNYTDKEHRKQPPKPDPEDSAYIDHYLIVEVVDLNDNVPKFERDTGTGGGVFQGKVNQNARAGTPIMRVHATDDDSGPRGRIRFDIQIDGQEKNPFTIDPQTHMLKTSGKSLTTQRYAVKVVAYDYGMPPKSSGIQLVSVEVGKTPPEFIGVNGVSYNLKFSEASVRGSVVATVTAVSKSGMPMTYEIEEEEARKTFAINDLGQITLLRELDFEKANETDKMFEFTVKGKENAVEGQVQTVRVNLNLENADDHLGMFKTPATKIRLKEGSALKGDVFTVEVEDCDCQKNCLCGSSEMNFTLGDTNGFFDITDDGQIKNVKNLDYETQNYFFFPVNVTDPGTNGRTRTSYIEVYVEDDDDTPPKFPVHAYEFFIFEDAPKGQVVGVTQAVDPDPSTQPNDVGYGIIVGTTAARKYFSVGNQGVIKVQENKDQFGKEDTYELVIQATDKQSVSVPPASVIIRILDVNDNQPVFTKCVSQTIKEDQPIGTVLTTLSATDNDRGFNKLIEFSIQNVQKHNFFAIDNTTGVVTTTHVLDREEYTSIFVVAKATDGGSTRSDALRQIGYCQFIVDVEDVNDHHPEFTVAKFDVTIKRTLRVKNEVLLVEAVDPDVEENAKIKYKIKSQQKNKLQKVDYFTVDPITGSLKVKKSLTPLSLLDKIYVVIQAYNKEKVVGSSSIAGPKTETTVIVSFTTEEPLKFEKTKYIVNGVKENIGAGKSILDLNVIGSRKGLYGLQTEIRDRDNIPFTFLDSTSGNIGTRKTLNYELKKSYLFAVTVSPIGKTVLSSAIVEINIQDVDDVSPIFGNDKYQATVSEAAKANVNVLRIKATDPDPASGGPMVYKLQSVHDYQSFQVLKVNDYAQIKTAKNLADGFFDRERKDVYTIIVDAYRENAPGLKGTTYVNIHVRDENDSPPVFKKKLYKASVPEGSEVPYTVPDITLMATDKDILENADISYFITSGNDGRFEMKTIYGRDHNNTGKLVVVRPLDVEKTINFQKNPVYNLTVTATDRKHTDTTTITITVLDRPEARPEFVEEYYEKYLPENVGPGVNVVQVKVKKQINVEFALDDKAKSYFAINRLTGQITTAGELLDWEKTPVITFPVYAFEKSNPKDTGQTFVRVIVNDVNDAPPYFPDQPYIGYVYENVPASTTVRYINGKDLDDPDVNSGNNVKLTYELLTNTGQDPYDKDGQLFTFNNQGLLVTRVTFDLEKYRRNLTVRVRAWDNGNPKLSGETDVTIVILDINERAAVFRKREYEASVSEIQPPGFVVLQLTVIDYDFAPRDNYAFSIIEGNNPYAFDISQETGEIVVAGVLGYDKDDKKKNKYELIIGLNERNGEFEIEGKGVNITVAHLDKAMVVITVTEGNDNRPTFGNTGKIYKATVAENIKVGTTLNVAPVIEATDADKGYSNQFNFLITKGNFGDWFGIRKDSKDSNKAVVFMQYPIDREYKSVYEMELIVKDYGGVSDMAKLIVTVTDVNDNPPVFHPSNYKATIKENDCKDDKPLVTLTLTDPDLPEKQKFKIEFAQKGNPGGRFRLTTTDNTTTLWCQRSINREETPNAKVIIKATDEGTPRLSSTAIVFVEVKDVDESSPKHGKMRIIVNAVDGDYNGDPIGKTYFEDKDGDGDSNMAYTLTGSEEFTIKKSTGWITAKSTVEVGKYQLRVTGRKGSGNLVSCDVDVDVRNLPTEAIQHSAAIQLKDVWNENSFLNPVRIDNSAGYEDLTYYDKFVNMLSNMFNVGKGNVFVFNIQMATKVMPGRKMPAVDVRFAIRKDSSVKSKFLPRYILINTLEKNNKTLKELGFKLGMIGIDYCVKESMRVGMCNNVVKRKGKSYSVVSSDYGLMPAPKYAVAVVCIDTTVKDVYSRYKEIPDPEYDECDPEPCFNGGTCHGDGDVLPHGFICECPAEYSGPRCQLTTRTFLGNSYIWLRPKTPYNYGSVSLEFATGAANGLLLYQGPAVKDGNNGRGDFLAISLVNGRIQVGLSFGGNPLVFTLTRSARLDNRKWHHVEVSHERKDITVIIDHCKHADIVEDDERIVERRENCEIITKTTRNYEYLNGLGPMQVGGIENMPLEYPSSKFVQYTHFSGCIRKIRDNLEMYDLAYPLKVVNAPVGCTVMAKCPTCLNGGYCYPGFGRSVCICAMGYVGDDCSGNAPRFYYLPNSFTEYTLPGEERRRKRGAAQEPSHLLDRYSVHISMQIRLNQGVKKAILFYASSKDNMEYNLLAYEEQKLYFEFKLLDALTRLEMPGEVEIDDQNWHNITVMREGNFAVLQVDYKGRVSRNTGGAKQLVRMASGKLYAGGLPKIAPNTTTVNKIVEAAVTDIRHRKRRSAGTIIGVTTDGEVVSSVAGDMTGCTGGSSYNGHNLDTNPTVKKVRFRVEVGCPCQEVLQCRNGGVCVSSSVPYCQCTAGWSGRTCEQIVVVAPILGNRVDGRARWRDGGVLIVILCVVLCVLILAIALIFIKKRREAPFSVPVGDEGQDSIMPYHDEGAGEEDTFNYDIHHLMKYSYRDGHGTVTKSPNGKEIASEHMELLSHAPGAMTMEMSQTSRKEAVIRESVDLWPFIQERVLKADEDMSWWAGDEMRHWDDEGDDEKAADLSEIEESDDEAEDAEQDWDFLKDWGRKFDNLNKIFNPDDDDDDDEETEA